MGRRVKLTGIILVILSVLVVGAGCSFVNSEKTDSVDQSADEEKTNVLEEKREGKTEQEQKEATNEGDEAEGQPMKKGILVAIDPGHQAPEIDMSGLEENAPGSTVLKAKATNGTTGSYTGIPEYQLNLDISLALRTELERRGYDVMLTRENNKTAVSNAERARLANDSGADIAVRIHANGSENTEVNGALTLIASAENPYVGHLYEESAALAGSILNAYCNSTGMQNLGQQTNDTMTGINWSEIPVVILEMGFMTNEQDDRNMADQEFREKMVMGIADGIDLYYEGLESAVLEEEIREQIAIEEKKGALVSVYAEQLDSEVEISLNNVPMKSASLIKLYIAGCVYENYEEVKAQDTYEGETENLIGSMISVSDNNAANTLVTRLGKGDSDKGMENVNSFCSVHGYNNTSMGRLLLDFSAETDNYTTVEDCGRFLKDIYYGNLPGSGKILDCLKAQKRVGKIPAGVPEGVVTANKTGELEDVENDAAIIYGNNGAYVLCVMMNDLEDTASGRKTMIRLSSAVYGYMSGDSASQ